MSDTSSGINTRLFLTISVLIILVMCSLLVFRASVDEVERCPYLRIADVAAAWGLSILSVGFPITRFYFGKDTASQLPLVVVAYGLSAVIWGFIIERSVCMYKRRSSAGASKK